ncbi:MAG: helix-turn-helix domain-containing protein [Bacteroidota bacterium]
MANQTLHFKGLYGDPDQVGHSNFIQVEPLALRSKRYHWEIEEHVHIDLFQLFWIQSGKGVLVANKKRFPFQGPCVISIPTETTHGFQFQPNIKGDVFSLSQDYIDRTLQEHPALLERCHELRYISAQNDAYFAAMDFVRAQFIKEWEDENAQKTTVIKSLFILWMSYLYRLEKKEDIIQKTSEDRSLLHFQGFKKLIRTSYLENKSIQAYAAALNISAVHLNRICRELSHQSAHELVEEHLVSEAKNYLLNTSYSISEIAYLLNFKDPAYFSRLFKKATGVSPKEFQKN